MVINYDSIIKRINKALDKAKSKLNQAGVHVCSIDDNVEELNGLVIIYHPDYKKPEIPTKPTAKYKNS